MKTVFRAASSAGSWSPAGNSVANVVDGAGAVLLASEQAIKEYGLQPLARFVGFSVCRRAARKIMGIGP